MGINLRLSQDAAHAVAFPHFRKLRYRDTARFGSHGTAIRELAPFGPVDKVGRCASDIQQFTVFTLTPDRVKKAARVGMQGPLEQVAC